MSRFLSASPAKRKFFLRLPVALLLLFLLWGTLGWPAFTLQGALRRMERENFTSPGRVVASGSVSLRNPDRTIGDNTNAWAVTYGDGAYRVATLHRILGFLWQPSDSSWNLYVDDGQHWDGLPYRVWNLKMADSGEKLECVDLFLIDGAARVETAVYRVPESLRGEGDTDWDKCEPVETNPAMRQAEGVWLIQYAFPRSDHYLDRDGDSYALRYIAYRADGSILYSN